MQTVLEVHKFLAPEIVFGSGAVDRVGRYTAHFGARRVLVVTDPGLVRLGLAERVTGLLENNGIEPVLFDRVSANPRDFEVMEGAELYRSEDCDVIVALGGGSPMDCAKGIAIVAVSGRHILEFEGIDKVEIPGPPLICIPTTAGSSADVSQFAIITNTQSRVKIAIISKTVVPDLALIDPETTLSMDRHLTVCTGLDVLVHAIEAYVSTAASPLTDLHALEAIRLIHDYLPEAAARLDDPELRRLIMLASLEAGLAFSNASLGAVHAMAHSLGGMHNLPHGECNGLLLEHVMAFNYPAAARRYDRIGEIFGVEPGLAQEERCGRLLEAIRAFRSRLGLEAGLERRAVRVGDLPELARKALADPCMVTNPRQMTSKEMETLFREAF